MIVLNIEKYIPDLGDEEKHAHDFDFDFDC